MLLYFCCRLQKWKWNDVKFFRQLRKFAPTAIIIVVHPRMSFDAEGMWLFEKRQIPVKVTSGLHLLWTHFKKFVAEGMWRQCLAFNTSQTMDIRSTFDGSQLVSVAKSSSWHIYPLSSELNSV